MSWETPPYDNESEPSQWSSPHLSHDNDLGTVADQTVDGLQWTTFLELWFADGEHLYKLCDKIRVNVEDTGGYSPALDIDACIDGGWAHIYEGSISPAHPDWMEIPIPGGPVKLAIIRIRFYNSEEESSNRFLIYEVQYNYIASRPLVNGSLAQSGLVTGGLVRCI
jgi:hypothetical protein